MLHNYFCRNSVEIPREYDRLTRLLTDVTASLYWLTLSFHRKSLSFKTRHTSDASSKFSMMKVCRLRFFFSFALKNETLAPLRDVRRGVTNRTFRAPKFNFPIATLQQNVASFSSTPPGELTWHPSREATAAVNFYQNLSMAFKHFVTHDHLIRNSLHDTPYFVDAPQNFSCKI